MSATKEIGLKIPLVVRLEGTNVEEGKRIIRESGLAITAASDLDGARRRGARRGARAPRRRRAHAPAAHGARARAAPADAAIKAVAALSN